MLGVANFSGVDFSGMCGDDVKLTIIIYAASPGTFQRHMHIFSNWSDELNLIFSTTPSQLFIRPALHPNH
jgi:hypothetical protein